MTMKRTSFFIIMFFLFFYASHSYAADEMSRLKDMLNELDGRQQQQNMSKADRINSQLRDFKTTPDSGKAAKFRTLDVEAREIIISSYTTLFNEKKAQYNECVEKRDTLRKQSEAHDQAMRNMAMQSGLFLPVFPSSQLGGIVYNCDQFNPKNFIPQWITQLNN